MYIKSRDYCVSAKHHVSMCLKVIRVALEMRSFVHVANYVTKAEQTPAAQVSSTENSQVLVVRFCRVGNVVSKSHVQLGRERQLVEKLSS